MEVFIEDVCKVAQKIGISPETLWPVEMLQENTVLTLQSRIRMMTDNFRFLSYFRVQIPRNRCLDDL